MMKLSVDYRHNGLWEGIEVSKNRELKQGLACCTFCKLAPKIK